MKIESIEQTQLDALIKAVTPMSAWIGGLLDVDVAYGRGVLDDSGRHHCLWTKEGKRVSVSIDLHGAIIISQSKEVDPEWEKRQGVNNAKGK
jgi:hypothetical protein